MDDEPNKNVKLTEIITMLSQSKYPECTYVGKNYSKRDLINDLIIVSEKRSSVTLQMIKNAQLKANELFKKFTECVEPSFIIDDVYDSIFDEMAQLMMDNINEEVEHCDCDDPSQCWEPCGNLGHDERYAKRVIEKDA